MNNHQEMAFLDPLNTFFWGYTFYLFYIYFTEFKRKYLYLYGIEYKILISILSMNPNLGEVCK